MCANWTRCSGRTSTFAPQSSSRNGPAGDRHEHGERRAVHAARAFHVKQPRREGGAGRAAGDERVRIPGGDGADGLDDRGLRGRAHGARRVGGLGDRDRGVDDLHPGRGEAGRPAPRSATTSGIRPAQFGGRPEDEHADVARGGGERRAARDLGGAGVGPVRVERDRQLLSGHAATLWESAGGWAVRPAPVDDRATRSKVPMPRAGSSARGRRPHGDASAAGTRCADSSTGS